MDLCVATLIGQGRNDQVLKVDRQNLSKAVPASSLEGVCSLISGSPCVGSGVSTGGEFIKEALVAVRFGAHEAQVLKRVRCSGVVVNLGCQSKVPVHFRTLLVDNDATHAGTS